MGLRVGGGRAEASEAATLPSREAWQPGHAGGELGQIHRYVILEEIGRGGMGVVYRALDPDLDREIALKLLTAPSGDNDETTEHPDGTGRGGKTGSTRDKMFREAQALAKLSHPNVIAVHDVGTFEGDVFLAMEFVPGDTVHRWCQRRQRSWREVVEVFVAAGEGLAAAHAAGIVHRDFKPSNVLVGDDGRVRVIDFGLARAADANASDNNISDWEANDGPLAVGSGYQRSLLQAPLTTVGLVCGTPHYMAPEQHLGGTASEATDQFSFCASLYEALYGERPFRADGRPARPSATAVKNVSQRSKRTVPAHIHRACMRGMSVRADERFPSIVELLAELRRDPTRRRRRMAVSAAVALSLAFGSWSAIAGRNEGKALLCHGAAEELAETWNPQRRDAVKQAFLATGVSYASDTFERVASALDSYGKDWVDMRTQACEATHVRGLQSEKVLDLRMACLDRKRHSLRALVGLFTDKPDRQVIDNAVEASLGLGGLTFCADTRALEQEVEPPEKPEDRLILAELRGRLEEVKQLDTLGKYREAEAHLKELTPRVDALGFAPLQAELAYHSASTLRYLGKYAEAEVLLREAVQKSLQRGMRELAAKAGAQATYLVGHLLHRHAEGLLYALHAQGLTRGRGDELEALSLHTLAAVHYAQGEYDRAKELHIRALAIRESLSPEDLQVAQSLNNLANVYAAQGKYAEAQRLYKRALLIKENKLGNDHPNVASSLNNLAAVCYSQGEYAEAKTLLKRAVTIREKAFGPAHLGLAISLINLGDVYAAQGEDAEAQELHRRALTIREKALGPDHPDVAQSLHSLAASDNNQGRYGNAEELNRRALAIFEKTHGSDHIHVAYPLLGLAETYEKVHRFTEALPLLERARKIRGKSKAHPKDRADAAFPLARVLWALGKDRTRARSLAQEALALYTTAGRGADKERRELEQWMARHR